jgi:PLAC8 family.
MFLMYEKTVGKSEITVFAILAGVPFAIVMCLCGIALWRLLKLEPNWSYELLVKWSIFYGNVNSLDLLKKCLLAVVFPWYFLACTFIKEKQETRKLHQIFTRIRFALPFYLWIGLLFLRISFNNLDHIAWAVFVFFLVQGSTLRRRIRRRLNIEGNLFEDTALMMIYPLTCIQMYEQLHPQITKSTCIHGASANGGFDLEDLRELNQRSSMNQRSVITPVQEVEGVYDA